MLIDSHAHLTSNEVFPHIDSILLRAKQGGIDAIINICTDGQTLERGIKLKKQYPWIHNTASTTPHDVEKEGELSYENLVFKYLRRSGYIGRLFELKTKLKDKELSIERKIEESK